MSEDCSVGFQLGGLGVFGIRFIFRIIIGSSLDHQLQTIRQHPGQAGRICNKILNSSTNDLLKYSFTAPTPKNKCQRLCFRCIQLISVKESHGLGIRRYCKPNRARHICCCNDETVLQTRSLKLICSSDIQYSLKAKETVSRLPANFSQFILQWERVFGLRPDLARV